MTSQRRQYFREPVALDLVLLCDGARTPGRTRDLSLGGMFIETDRRLPFGTQVVLEVVVPGAPTPVTIDATVRWADADGVGVQFAALRAVAVWALHQVLRANAGGRHPSGSGVSR